MKSIYLLQLAVTLLTLVGCAHSPGKRQDAPPDVAHPAMGVVSVSSDATADAEDLYSGVLVRDPWERFNRRMHAFNSLVDRALIRPMARGYARVVPEPARAGVSRFFDHWKAPVTAVNQALQGRLRTSLRTLGRFAVNSTVGVAGFFDAATGWSLPDQGEEDFGQTLATWGWRDSRYLVLPLLGPGSVRDTFGVPVDHKLAPITYIDDSTASVVLSTVELLELRASLLGMDQALDEAADEYALVRDVWAQRRRHELDQPEREPSRNVESDRFHP